MKLVSYIVLFSPLLFCKTTFSQIVIVSPFEETCSLVIPSQNLAKNYNIAWDYPGSNIHHRAIEYVQRQFRARLKKARAKFEKLVGDYPDVKVAIEAIIRLEIEMAQTERTLTNLELHEKELSQEHSGDNKAYLKLIQEAIARAQRSLKKANLNLEVYEAMVPESVSRFDTLLRLERLKKSLERAIDSLEKGKTPQLSPGSYFVVETNPQCPNKICGVMKVSIINTIEKRDRSYLYQFSPARRHELVTMSEEEIERRLNQHPFESLLDEATQKSLLYPSVKIYISHFAVSQPGTLKSIGYITSELFVKPFARDNNEPVDSNPKVRIFALTDIPGATHYRRTSGLECKRPLAELGEVLCETDGRTFVRHHTRRRPPFQIY